MEKRLVLAIVLSFLLLLVWQLVLVKKSPELQTAAEQTVPVQTGQVQPVPEQKKADVAAPQPPAQKADKPLNIKQISASGEDKITLDTSLYQAVWSNKGGVLTSWKLRKHKNEKKEFLDLVPLSAKDAGVYPFSLYDDAPDSVKAGLQGIVSSAYNSALYKVTGSSGEVRDGEKAEIRFNYADGKELEIEKIFTFYGGRYDFDIAVAIRRNGQPVEPRILWGPGIGNPSESELKQSFGSGGGTTVFASNSLYRVDEKKYKPEQSAFNFVTWAAYDDNYFAAMFLPAAAGGGTAAFLKEDVENKASYFFLSAANPGKAFVGPKDFDALTAFGHDAKKIVRFGFFGFIAEILFVTLKFIHKFVPNWGFAIIILTFIIKVLFFPLTYHSTKSMAKMADLQPKIKALRAKYKKSKTDIAQRRQMNEEMMKLYKENGVNPAGGCLPMILQIPVFFGLFSLLRVAIELRQSPWILWIKDLSIKDPLYITPLLMGATQFISQKMTPTTADPAQARMMLIMPVVMTFFFMNFQSGLVIYWLTSNVLQIGQQYIMNRMMHKKKVESHGKPRKK
ncbi:MAG: membrane protein insertase YidC [Candidatus Aminicenantes bacterium]|nr:membrane protein insertase YidC [Candidatus Aminicenantes bacterium]